MKNWISILLFLGFGLSGIGIHITGYADDSQSKLQPHRLLLVNGPHSNQGKVRLFKEVAQHTSEQHQLNWDIDYYSASELIKQQATDQEMIGFLAEFDLVILNAVSKREVKSTFADFAPWITAAQTATITVNDAENTKLNQGISSALAAKLLAYWENGGRQNLTNLLLFMDAQFSSTEQTAMLAIAEPVIIPDQGIYHPQLSGLIATDLSRYQAVRKPQPNQPKIALLMQRASIETEQTQLIDSTITLLEDRGAYVVPFYFEMRPNSNNYDHLLQVASADHDPSGAPVTAVDLIINFRNIHWASQRKTEFARFGVPVLQAMTYYSGDQAAWQADPQGISATMMPFTLVLPESAGVVDPMVVAAMDMDNQQPQIIDPQLEHLVNKAMNMVKLKYKANQDKKLAVFLWGSEEVSASFMNIYTSLYSMSQRLAAEGYHSAERDQAYFVENVAKILDPFYRDYQLKSLLAADLADLMPIDEYLRWFETLPVATQQQINQHWGKPQDSYMAVIQEGKEYLVIPRIRNGNMLIMRQPPRSDHKNDEDNIYHQEVVPVNHYYLASYFYVRQFWQADAIIHFGTHGSQEYLPGKERGLSMFDHGNLAVWDTPVVYPFIVDDVGEAMQTKRRGRATVISHMTPPFAAAGLHGDIARLHELMHQYKSLDAGGVKQKTADQLVEVCFSTNICKDLSWGHVAIQANFAEFMQDLHLHLDSLSRANQPLGLHTFGELAEQPLLTSTIVQMLPPAFSQSAAQFEQTYYQAGFRHSHDGETHTHGHSMADDGEHFHNYHDGDSHPHANQQSLEQSLQRLAGYKTVYNYIVNADQSKPDGSHKAQQPLEFEQMPELLQNQIKKGREYYQAMLANHELDGLVDFLSNKYVDVKTGGDPIRHQDSLPTGYNLYGFDPAKVPTKAAYEQGKELVEKMINDYYQEHQVYPDKLAFSLWSIETMRHYGVLEAQAMYAMGIRPKWGRSSRVIGTEVIPYEQLQRPRIDVVLSATGLYRDAFPSVMQLLANGINKIAALKEQNNFVYRHSQQVKQQLLDLGVEEQEAEYLSTIRIFSNQSGDYSSGVDSAVLASDTWQTDAKIANNYMTKMGFFFGADSRRWGEKVYDKQGQVIDLYAKQLSGTDIALFARSSNLYGMLSTDDPFEYFGALSLAVRNIDGKSPQMLVSNLRQANQAQFEDAALFLAKELRTRVFHPRWIKAMQEEGRSGAITLASRMDNFFGWQVVSPELVRADQWDEYMDVYLNDVLEIDIDQWFKQVNPRAFANMLERMLEAKRKGYWPASEQRLQRLLSQYIELVNQHDLVVLNNALQAYVNQQAQGFGLTPLHMDKSLQDMAANALQQQQQNNQDLMAQSMKSSESSPLEQDIPEKEVQGQVLEKQTAQPSAVDDFALYALLLILMVVVLGGIKQQFGLRWQARTRR